MIGSSGGAAELHIGKSGMYPGCTLIATLFGRLARGKSHDCSSFAVCVCIWGGVLLSSWTGW